MTRAFSGRLGRAIETDYTRAINSPEAPSPAQGGLTPTNARRVNSGQMPQLPLAGEKSDFFFVEGEEDEIAQLGGLARLPSTKTLGLSQTALVFAKTSG